MLPIARHAWRSARGPLLCAIATSGGITCGIWGVLWVNWLDVFKFLLVERLRTSRHKMKVYSNHRWISWKKRNKMFIVQVVLTACCTMMILLSSDLAISAIISAACSALSELSSSASLSTIPSVNNSDPACIDMSHYHLNICIQNNHVILNKMHRILKCSEFHSMKYKLFIDNAVLCLVHDNYCVFHMKLNTW